MNFPTKKLRLQSHNGVKFTSVKIQDKHIRVEEQIKIKTTVFKSTYLDTFKIVSG